MELSVVVPTLNARDELSGCLDALAAHAPAAEVIVVNGPSADGTTGMIQERDDVAVLVELADRSINAARNAGIDRTTGETIAFLDHRYTISPKWTNAIAHSLDTGASAVTGPKRARMHAEQSDETPEQRTIAGRDVTFFQSGNVAFEGEVLDELDGFDEYLEIGGSRDVAHRLAALGRSVAWNQEMAVTKETTTAEDRHGAAWNRKYQSLAYRLVKNYNLRPTVVARLVKHAVQDGSSEFAEVGRGNKPISAWVKNGSRVLSSTVIGCKDGFSSRRADKTPRRNPRGRSTRSDRAVTVYDWR